jgi:mRNA interferase MazF
MLLQGEIVLLPIPFTDLSSQKRRPVVVISNDAYHASTTDMVVVAMTSNPASVEYGFIIESADLDRGRLNHPGTIRVDKIYTLSQSLIVARFGRVRRVVLDRIGASLQELVRGPK